MFGLRKVDIDFIIKEVKKVNKIDRVAIFGSRAREEYKDNSDIDIVLFGKNIDKRDILKLYELLEENAPYPFFVVSLFPSGDAMSAEACAVFRIDVCNNCMGL